MVVFPNIKINLGLQVLRKRDDGYHDISTVMIGVDWTDVLEIVPALDGVEKLVVSGLPVNCPPEKNLVMKAVNAVRERVGKLPEVHVFLHKNVPDGAGLGGGSSDAAFTILALNELFDLGLSRPEMADIAAHIGSDCPFFIYNIPMLASGRGEILEPLHDLGSILSKFKVAIVKPVDVSVSTAVAYAGVTPSDNRQSIIECLKYETTDWRKNLVNDFEGSVFKHCPETGVIKDKMYDLGCVYAAMSGSGSAVFGIFEPEALKRIEFEKIFPGCVCHTGYFIV